MLKCREEKYLFSVKDRFFLCESGYLLSYCGSQILQICKLSTLTCSFSIWFTNAFNELFLIVGQVLSPFLLKENMESELFRYIEKGI